MSGHNFLAPLTTSHRRRFAKSSRKKMVKTENFIALEIGRYNLVNRLILNDYRMYKMRRSFLEMFSTPSDF